MKLEESYLNPELVEHLFRHVSKQVRRYRRSQHIGIAEPRGLEGIRLQYASWADVGRCRSNARGTRELSQGQRHTLAAETGPCPVCGCGALDLSWFRFVTPPETWAILAGFGGWMATCDSCREQVAFFIDVEN